MTEASLACSAEHSSNPSCISSVCIEKAVPQAMLTSSDSKALSMSDVFIVWWLGVAVLVALNAATAAMTLEPLLMMLGRS